MKRAKKPTVYVMTRGQDAVWESAFVEAKDRGKSDAVADRLAFEAVAKRWPQVREFDKLAPDVREGSD